MLGVKEGHAASRAVRRRLAAQWRYVLYLTREIDDLQPSTISSSRAASAFNASQAAPGMTRS